MNCHKSTKKCCNLCANSNVSSSRCGPHDSVQADVFFGQNAAEFGSAFLSNSHQFAITDACVTCHMVATADTGTVNRDKVGGHSFNISIIQKMDMNIPQLVHLAMVLKQALMIL